MLLDERTMRSLMISPVSNLAVSHYEMSIIYSVSKKVAPQTFCNIFTYGVY